MSEQDPTLSRAMILARAMRLVDYFYDSEYKTTMFDLVLAVKVAPAGLNLASYSAMVNMYEQIMHSQIDAALLDKEAKG